MSFLIKSATVVTMDAEIGDFVEADILITDGKISRIGNVLDHSGAEIINAEGMIAMPGFVNGHIHLWQTALRGMAGNWALGEYFHTLIDESVENYRPEDAFIGNLVGALDQLNNGVTTLMDWCHIVNTPEHADAAVDAHLESGIRAVFAYGTPMGILLNPDEPHPADARRMRQERLTSDTDLITMALAIRGPDFAPGTAEADIRYARDLGVHTSFHVGCGKFGPRGEPIVDLADAGLLGPDINLVHANFLTDREFQSTANCGSSIAITPEVEMQMALGMPPTGAALSNGIPITLGTDVVTGVSTDMFSQMRFLLQTERARQNDMLLLQDTMPDQLNISARDVLGMATIDGAKALGLDRHTGSLTPGKCADIVLIRATDINLACIKDPTVAIVLHANPANVDTVLVNGEIRKSGGRLTHPGYEKALEDLNASSEHLFEAMSALN